MSEFNVAGDQIDSITYGVAAELFVQRVAWQGDLWIADVVFE